MQTVEKGPVNDLFTLLNQLRGPVVLPVTTPEQKAAMAHNRWINLHRYENPMDYMFDYDDSSSSSEDE